MTQKIKKLQLQEELNLLRTSTAESLCLGSARNIFLTRSLALLDMEGQGSDAKSIWPRRIASNIPCSFSSYKGQRHSKRRIGKAYYLCHKGKAANKGQEKGNFHTKTHKN